MINKKVKRDQSLGEEIGNAVTHGCGFIFSIVGMILLFIKADESIEFVSISFFCFGLLCLYIMSCLYHSFKKQTMVKKIFKIFDHSSIYFLIAGTYTPIWLLVIGGVFGLVSLIIMWSMVVFGVLLKVLFINKGKILSLCIYLIMGWCGLAVLPKLNDYNSNLLLFILLGGVAYSIGVYFYIAKFKYAHFIWHFFVLAGSILHFIGIYLFIV